MSAGGRVGGEEWRIGEERIYPYFILLEIRIWCTKTVIIVQGMLELACTGLDKFLQTLQVR